MKKGQRERERNNEKTDGWNKARKTDEQFAIVRLGERREVAECAWKWRERVREKRSESSEERSIARRRQWSLL